MSTMEQMEDNLHTFSEDTALENADKELLFEAAELFKSQVLFMLLLQQLCSFLRDGNVAHRGA